MSPTAPATRTGPAPSPVVGVRPETPREAIRGLPLLDRTPAWMVTSTVQKRPLARVTDWLKSKSPFLRWAFETPEQLTFATGAGLALGGGVLNVFGKAIVESFAIGYMLGKGPAEAIFAFATQGLPPVPSVAVTGLILYVGGEFLVWGGMTLAAIGAVWAGMKVLAKEVERRWPVS